MIGNRIALIVGGLGMAAVAVSKNARRRRASVAPAGGDGRAEELRRKLAEARTLAGEREEFEGAETPVDQARVPDDTDERRRRIHDEGQAAADEMRGGVTPS